MIKINHLGRRCRAKAGLRGAAAFYWGGREAGRHLAAPPGPAPETDRSAPAVPGWPGRGLDQPLGIVVLPAAIHVAGKVLLLTLPTESSWVLAVSNIVML